MEIGSIGFTGTRDGMTAAQTATVFRLLLARRVAAGSRATIEFHYGDCVGSDAEAWMQATSLGYRTVAHPPLDRTLRAFTSPHESREPRGYADRDRDIVDASGLLIATPRTFEEQRRGSGTWLTIRHARRTETPRVIVWPDGREDRDDN